METIIGSKMSIAFVLRFRLRLRYRCIILMEYALNVNLDFGELIVQKIVEIVKIKILKEKIFVQFLMEVVMR